MKATCQRTELKTVRKTVTENTPWGSLTKDIKTVYTRQDWTNYPGKVSEFSNLSVNVYTNCQLTGGFVTGDKTQIARHAAEAGFTF